MQERSSRSSERLKRSLGLGFFHEDKRLRIYVHPRVPLATAPKIVKKNAVADNLLGSRPPPRSRLHIFVKEGVSVGKSPTAEHGAKFARHDGRHMPLMVQNVARNV